MKVFSVAGFTKSGKTTTIEEIIKELKHRNYSVGSVKDIHFEGFHIDTEGTNTHRHKMAGSELVTARGLEETDILFQKKLDIYEIAKFYDVDYLILEGVIDANVPIILTADSIEDLDKRYDGRSFLVSGKIADEIDRYKDLDAISALSDVKALVDLIEAVVFPLLPDYDPKCCGECGYNCRDLCARIIKGESRFEDCTVLSDEVQLFMDGQKVKMVPFVQSILKNTLEGVVKELDGYSSNSVIEVKLGKDFTRS